MQVLKRQYIDIETEKFIINYTDLKIGTANTSSLLLRSHPKGTQIMWSQIKLLQTFAGTTLTTASIRLQDTFSLSQPDDVALAYNTLSGLTLVGDNYGRALAAPARQIASMQTPQPIVMPLNATTQMYIRFVANMAFNVQNLTAGKFILWYSHFRAT